MLRWWRDMLEDIHTNGCEPTDANYATISFSVPYGVISQYSNILQYTPVTPHLGSPQLFPG